MQIGGPWAGVAPILRQHLHAHARFALLKRHDPPSGLKASIILRNMFRKPKIALVGRPSGAFMVGGHGVKGAMHERVAVDNGKGAALVRHIEYLALGWARFAHSSLRPRPAATSHQAPPPP